MLAAKRDIAAVKRFFRKMMQADYRRLPFSISTDKHASYPEAFTAMQVQKVLAFDCRLRRTKHLRNIVEQDHRHIKRLVRPGLGFKSFTSASQTIAGYEAMAMM